MSAQDNSSQTILKNSAYSFLGYSLPIIFSVAITPLIVSRLGVNDFGIYVLIFTINGFLTLIDLGIGLALIKYASEYRVTNQQEKLAKLVGSVNLLFVAFGIVGLLVYAIIGAFFLSVFNIPSQEHAHILPVFAMAGLVFFIGSLSIIPTSLLKAWQRYDLTVKTSLIYLTLFNFASLAIVLLGYKLKVLFFANLSLTFLAWLVYVFWAKRTTGLKLLHFEWDWQEVKRCYRFGIAAFITNISNNALTQLDRLIIPMYFSPVQLSYYSLPGNVTEKINGVTGSSTAILFPALSSLVAAGEKDQIKNIYIRIFRNIPVLTAAMALSAALFADKILRYWVGADFARNGAKILVILAGTNAILALYSVLQNFLLGFGKVRFLMKASVFMAMLNIGLLLYLVPKFSITGAAWAYLISVSPIIFIFYWVETRFLGLIGRVLFYVKLTSKLLIVSLLFYLLYRFLLGPMVQNLLSLVIVGGASIPIFLIIYRLLGFFEAEDLQTYRNFLAKISDSIKTKLQTYV